MNKLHNIIIMLILTLLSCIKQTDKIGLSGSYINSDSADYSKLELKPDSSFFFYQSVDYYNLIELTGNWKIVNNEIVLYESINFSNNIIIDTLMGVNIDSLTIKIDTSVYSFLQDIKLSLNIEGDSDLDVNKNSVNIFKPNYINILKLPESNRKYKRTPVSLNLRNKIYFATIDNILQYKYVKIYFDKNNFSVKKQKVLAKFSIKDSIIETSYNLDSVVVKCKLKKQM